MDLKGKTAMVTGSAKRVGKALSLRLAQLGCHMILHYQSSESEARALSEEIQAMGLETCLIQGDLSDPAACREVAEKAWAWRGEIHALVNSAANFIRSPLKEAAPQDWIDSLGLNLLAPFWLSQSIGLKMAEQGCGKIINIADISWRAPWKDHLPYCVSKAGLVALTQGLARALAPQVQVNAIAPGAVLFPDDYPESLKLSIVERNLLKRAGTAEDVADALEFFCRCDFADGVLLPIDGGQSIAG